MRKKRISILLCGAMLAAMMLMSGCGKEAEEAGAEIKIEIETEIETETEIEMETKIEMEMEIETTEETAEETETAVPQPETPKDSNAVDEPAAMPAPVLSSIRVYGSVQEMNDGKIFIKNDNQNDMYNQVILNVSEETKILDAVNAEEKTVADITAGEALYAYVSPMMTRSMPPMSNAEMIICDIPADFAAPEYAEIVSVTTEADGRISLLTNRDMIYWVGEGADTEILDYETGEKVDVSSIKEGSRVLAWYQLVLESFPGQTTPNKIIVF